MVRDSNRMGLHRAEGDVKGAGRGLAALRYQEVVSCCSDTALPTTDSSVVS